MKFGVADYGLNVWYGGLYDLETRLQNLRELGFEGIERLEANGSGDSLSKAALCRRSEWISRLAAVPILRLERLSKRMSPAAWRRRVVRR